ncbi:sodium-coupled monocarboxylate transporter 2-like [Tropilaelaps mercedesae]|uniref:Sodium-coupled monocarboxylate transporter 2-like n=1 Tax=Tropilaelaps mercedesae TaxID=418985 RepID=A0A1V9X2P0_9ACAR|nr:sodium-coupled monocarboxylate transporter 2-like [Tropilaelaps mercedesae]
MTMDPMETYISNAVFVPLREPGERFTTYDYAIYVMMLVCSGVVGLYCAFVGGTEKTPRQLLSGDGNLSPLIVSMSLFASFTSATFIFGHAAEVYLNNTMIFIAVFSYCLTLFITASYFVPVFFELGVHSTYQYLELRFSRSIRLIAAITHLVETTIYMGVALYAPAFALSQLTGITISTAVCSIGLVCTIYTSIGGIKSVVYTDAFQCIVMLVAMAVVVVYGFAALGGVERVWMLAQRGHRISFFNFSLNPTVRHTMWGLVLGTALTNASSFAANNMMVLRYFTVPSLRAAKCIIWMNLPLLVAVLTLSCLSGLLVYARYYNCDPLTAHKVSTSDQLLPYFIFDVLSRRAGMSGLFVAGMFAASLSSVSSAVNAITYVLYIDVFLLVKPTMDAQSGVKVFIFLGIIVGLLPMVLVPIAEKIGRVLSAMIAVNSGLGGPLLGLFAVAIFFPTVNSTGAFCGFAVSLPFSLYLSVAPIVTGAQTYTPNNLSVKGCQEHFIFYNDTRKPKIVPDLGVEPIKRFRSWVINNFEGQRDHFDHLRRGRKRKNVSKQILERIKPTGKQ